MPDYTYICIGCGVTRTVHTRPKTNRCRRCHIKHVRENVVARPRIGERPGLGEYVDGVLAQVRYNIEHDLELDGGLDTPEEFCRRFGIPIDYEVRRRT